MPMFYYFLLSMFLGALTVWLTSATPGLLGFLRSRSADTNTSYSVKAGFWLAGIILPLWGALTFAVLQVFL